MDPNLASLYASSVIHMAFCCVALDLRTGETISLLDGASQITFTVDGINRTFIGEDATFGTLATFDAVEEGVATNSPRLRVSFNPPSESALAILANPVNQGSVLRLWNGAVNTNTGVAYANLEFLGRLDRAQRGLQKNSGSLEIDCSSYFDDLFIEDEGLRLNDDAHRAIRPSEAGMAYVSAVTRKLPWGLEKGTPPSVVGGGATTGGGGGFSGVSGSVIGALLGGGRAVSR